MTKMRRGNRGDLYVTVDVEVPVNLSEKQKGLLKEFHALSQSENNSPHSRSFTDKLKEFWRTIRD